jgi:hypothetical protein
MKRYRFIGSYTEVQDKLFSRFGQWVDWDESFYLEMVKVVPFIPEADFQKLGVTSDELGRYAEYGTRVLAPDSFNEKVSQAARILIDIRQRSAQSYEQDAGEPDDVSAGPEENHKEV